MEVTLSIPACVAKIIPVDEKKFNEITQYALKVLGVAGLIASLYVFSASVVALPVGGVIFAVCWLASCYFYFNFPERELAWDTLLSFEGGNRQQQKDRLDQLPDRLVKRYCNKGLELLFLVELELGVAALFSWNDLAMVKRLADVNLQRGTNSTVLRDVAWCKKNYVPIGTCLQHSLVLPKERPPYHFCPLESTEYARIAFVLELYHFLETSESPTKEEMSGLAPDDLERIRKQMEFIQVPDRFQYFSALFKHREILGQIDSVEEGDRAIFFEYFSTFVTRGGMSDHPFFVDPSIPLERRAEGLSWFARRLQSAADATTVLRIMKIHSSEFAKVEPGIVCGLIVRIIEDGMTDEAAIAEQVRSLIIRANIILEGIPETVGLRNRVCHQLRQRQFMEKGSEKWNEVVNSWFRTGITNHPDTWLKQSQTLCEHFDVGNLEEILHQPESHDSEYVEKIIQEKSKGGQ